MTDQTTAVATRQEVPRAVAKPAITSGGALAALVPQDLDQAYRLSEALAKAGDMVPETYRGQPMKIMAAVVKGMEIGLAPMQALASIAVINGRPSLWGDALRALILRAGHHIDCVVEGSGKDAAAVATLTRSSGKTVVRRFSMADAERAGLLKKSGPWQQYPTRMLMNRATAFAVRDGAADALMGLAVADEVSDYGPDRARDVTPAAPRPGRARYVDDTVDDIIDTAPGADAAPETVHAEILTPEQQAEEAADFAALQQARQGDMEGA